MGKLILCREKKIVASLAKYNIYLDLKRIGFIKNGEELEFELESGNHEIFLENGTVNFGKSSNKLEFESLDNSIVKIKVRTVMSNLSGIKVELISNTNLDN